MTDSAGRDADTKTPDPAGRAEGDPRTDAPADSAAQGDAADSGRAALSPDLETLDAESFRPHLDTVFEAVTGDGTRVPLRLEQVSENPRGTMPGAARTAFSLILRGDWSLLLSSGFYRLTHPEAGDFGALYMSAIMPPRGYLDDETAYQIIFN